MIAEQPCFIAPSPSRTEGRPAILASAPRQLLETALERFQDATEAILAELDRRDGDSDLEEGWDREWVDEREPEEGDMGCDYADGGNDQTQIVTSPSCLVAYTVPRGTVIVERAE